MTTITTSTELEDSSHLLGDWGALRARMAEDGYVFVRGLLDGDTVRAVGRTGLGHLQAAGWIAPGPDPTTAPPRLPVRAVRMRDAFGQPGYREIVADPGFARIPFTSPFTDLMRQLLGPDGFCYPLKLPRVVYPISAVPHQPGNYVHKDYGSVQDMFTCWVPLGDVPRTLGGLAVEPGSQHRASIRPRPLDALPAGWLTTDYRAGDVLVFHCLTTHAALPNHEHRMRFSAEYRWQLADQPAPRRLVIGPFGNEIGSRLFSRTSWWHPAPRGLVLFDDGGPQHRRLPVPPSRFVRVDDTG
ncbi:MAG TPA: phytanoyl-CoA dioxygenase family protein [Acidimicrobiia bacterium]|nr:phytanoyl-CoA dioxygenase family protein [Acidimicrobiia bacterium]